MGCLIFVLTISLFDTKRRMNNWLPIFEEAVFRLYVCEYVMWTWKLSLTSARLICVNINYAITGTDDAKCCRGSYPTLTVKFSTFAKASQFIYTVYHISSESLTLPERITHSNHRVYALLRWLCQNNAEPLPVKLGSTTCTKSKHGS